MGKRKSPVDTMGYSPPSPPESTLDTGRPVTISSPVQIPKNGKRVTSHAQKRLSGTPRRVSSQAHLAGNISPSVAALLAVTDIPKMGSQRRKRRSEQLLTATDIVDRQQMSEKEFSWNMSRTPMDVLLSPPEEFADDMSIAASDCNTCSALSTRTMSVDSLPSLGDSFATDGISSIETPGSPSLSMRRRKMSPMRRSLEPLQSPPGEDLDHPLSKKHFHQEEPALEPLPESIEEESSTNLFGQFKPFRYAFKSNLTASIRALRSAAKSFSAINFSSIPSDDFLTRSLLTIDPNVPYADERRPPVMDDIPSAEVRRYLNPTTSPRVETHPVTIPPPRKFSASIQMQTYKVQRSKVNSGRNNYPRSSPQHGSLSQPEEKQASDPGPQTPAPAVRQREMRENSDFIRIAVMEMAMRKRGKLDDQTPGRARWALPPRKSSTVAYQIGADGVPARWIAITC
ncbi:unnamed protein product [Clonostachys rhizophaga]|uniref:Uncharacterized protein n=1 Tax=Clonostachys rhizophaga TaxID=160324 RepID=A0A9N9V7E3_9HYPO|nr:unnamed protein product [Clonostachys rhizophaga]